MRQTILLTAMLVVAMLGVTGCPGTVNQLNHVPAGKPLEQPVLINRPGPLLHEASGFQFQESYGEFQRVTAYRYDTAGLDVGVGYDDRRPDCLIAATFYVYPTPRMSFVGAAPEVVASMETDWLAREYARSKADIQQVHRGMAAVVEGAAVTPPDLQGRSLTFQEGGDASELGLFVYGHQWFLKYRFTYPQRCQADARALLEGVVQQLPWATIRPATVR